MRPRRLLTPKLPQSKIHHKPPIEMRISPKSLGPTPLDKGRSLFLQSSLLHQHGCWQLVVVCLHLPCAGCVGYDMVLVCDNLTHFDARRVEISMNDRLTCEEALPSSPIHRQHIPHRGVGSDPCSGCTSHSQTQAACSWAGPLGCRWGCESCRWDRDHSWGRSRFRQRQCAWPSVLESKSSRRTRRQCLRQLRRMNSRHRYHRRMWLESNIAFSPSF
mmetsp:Transcript_26039/g.85681  ORF Transcript_26039/g.85681 Transcript_26039/m.85681 type:complete len:217 (+) Transcript_26039:836-1486(+)